jgi:ribose transport system permease protein
VKVVVARILDLRIFVILGVVVLLMWLAVPSLGTAESVQNILSRVATVGLIAVGMTLVVLAGQLDLSVGSTLALSGVLAIGLQPAIGPIPAIVVGISVGPVIGLLNGLLVVGVGMNAFIATIGTMVAVRGFTYLVAGGRTASGLFPEIGVFIDGPLLGPVTVRSGAFLAGVVIAAFVLARMRVGRNLYAVGGNPESSRLAGVDPRVYVTGAFIVCGLTASVAGVLLALTLNTGSPVIGLQVLITVITAVVLGGTSLAGGAGGPLLTLGGVLVLGVLGSGLDHLNVPAPWQSVVTGLLLIVVVLLDTFVGRRRRTAAARRPRVQGVLVSGS